MAMSPRLSRRMAGLLGVRLHEAGLEQVPDPRRRGRQRRWRLHTLLRAVVLGIAAGCKSLAQTETLTDEMSKACQRFFRIHRRVPDTTMRDAIIQLGHKALRACLYRQVSLAHRRKALTPDGLPFGVVAMDGKATSLPVWDDDYAQFQPNSNGVGAHGSLRTYTASLVSSRAVVCLDAAPIPSCTNEVGFFSNALDDLVEAYRGKGLFQLVATDAGGCSRDNATHVVETHGLDYLFALKGSQPELSREAQRLLSRRRPEEADAESQDVTGKTLVIRRVYLSEDMDAYHDWQHLRTVLRVESEHLDLETGDVIERDPDDCDRYYLCSLSRERLSDDQWLLLVRRYWGVENQCHHTWDTAFREDEHPWLVAEPQGTLAIMLLRRVAANAFALFRGVTLRGEEQRLTPWKTILRWAYNTLLVATEHDLARLRKPRATMA